MSRWPCDAVYSCGDERQGHLGFHDTERKTTGIICDQDHGTARHAETAIDASTSWTRFRSMGFLHLSPPPQRVQTDTPPTRFLFQKPQDYIDKLSAGIHHINALQYYDWRAPRGSPSPLATSENEWPLAGYRNNYASKKMITDYITDATYANSGFTVT